VRQQIRVPLQMAAQYLEAAWSQAEGIPYVTVTIRQEPGPNGKVRNLVKFEQTNERQVALEGGQALTE
jgi:hypothetical protein